MMLIEGAKSYEKSMHLSVLAAESNEAVSTSNSDSIELAGLFDLPSSNEVTVNLNQNL